MIFILYASLVVFGALGAITAYMAYLDWLWSINRRILEKDLRRAWLQRLRASAKDATDAPYTER